ncbi:MAG: accessory gene regulator B family protein [Bacilli bacterium]|nr:accessory gene regulator B family protein [Bacilli bacterium]
MFKDYKKYLKTSLKVYLFVLIILFILKIVGLDYFGIDVKNPVLIKIDGLFAKYHLKEVWYFITIYLQLYFYLCLVCKRRGLYIYTLIGSIINILVQYALTIFLQPEWYYQLFSFILTLILPMIVNKKFCIKRQIIFIILINVYQLISLFIRNVGVNSNYGNFILDSILNLDQLLLLVITYNVFFMKGEIICLQEVGSSLLKKINLKKSLQRLQKNLQSNLEAFKKKNKQEKLTIIIFSILSLIWNCLTLLVVFIIAMMNDSVIECIFIISSFWLSKRSFGKAFHFDSMIICFIVSNITYFVLNRITTPLGISIFIPILLGVGLSYVTSKLVKKIYKPLYRGMPEDLFEETILQVVDKDSDKYNICYEFYIEKKSDLALSYKYNYSVSGIRKIKDRINDKIKRL